MWRITSNSLHLPKAFRFFKHLETVSLSAENSNARIKSQVISPKLICNATTHKSIQLLQLTTKKKKKRRMTVNCARNYWERSPEIWKVNR